MDKYPRESSPRELSATEAAGIRELTADEIDAVAGGLTLPVGIYTALSHVPSPIDSAATHFPPTPVFPPNPVFTIFPPQPIIAALFGKAG